MALMPVMSKFDFYQQIRLLLRKLRDGVTPDVALLDEKIQISSTLSLNSPNGQVESIHQETPDAPIKVIAWHNGLTGAMGALPTAYSEWLVERYYRYGDHSAKAFIDLFGHRLYCLDYLAWQKYNLCALAESQGKPPLQVEILALTGRLMGPSSPEKTQNVILYSSSVRSMTNLECLLYELFGVSAQIIPFTGGWHTVSAEECCQLGNPRQILAIAPMLGRARVEVDSHFDVILGPMSWTISRRFTQMGRTWREVWDCIRSYVGPVVDFSIFLTISSAGLTPFPLGMGALGLDLCLGCNKVSDVHQVQLPAPAV